MRICKTATHEGKIYFHYDVTQCDLSLLYRFVRLTLYLLTPRVNEPLCLTMPLVRWAIRWYFIHSEVILIACQCLVQALVCWAYVEKNYMNQLLCRPRAY